MGLTLKIKNKEKQEELNWMEEVNAFFLFCF